MPYVRRWVQWGILRQAWEEMLVECDLSAKSSCRRWGLAPERIPGVHLLALLGGLSQAEGATSWIGDCARCVRGPAVWLEQDAWEDNRGAKVREERRSPQWCYWSGKGVKGFGAYSFEFSFLQKISGPNMVSTLPLLQRHMLKALMTS